jgi:hypothetical protein
MQNSKFFGAAAGLALLVPVASANDFLGETITMGHYSPNVSTIFDGPYTTTIVNGTSDEVFLTASLDRVTDYVVNVDQFTVTVDFLRSVNFTAGDPFHGLIISNLVSSDAWNFAATGNPYKAFSYDGSTLELNWQGNFVSAGSEYQLTLQTQSVPEPSAVMLMVAGAFGLCLRRKS